MESGRGILEADHAELHDLLDRAFAALHERDLTNSYRAIDLFWARLAMHIRAEHLHLFPFVRSKCDLDTSHVLDELRDDHDMFMTALARAVKALRLAFDFGNETETFAIVRALLEPIAARLPIHDRIEEENIYSQIAADRISAIDEAVLREGITNELRNYPLRFASVQPGGNKKTAGR